MLMVLWHTHRHCEAPYLPIAMLLWRCIEDMLLSLLIANGRTPAWSRPSGVSCWCLCVLVCA